MRTHNPAFFLIAGLAPTLTLLTSANAADMPLRRSGLWEIKTAGTTVGKKMPRQMTMPMRLNQSKESS